jgi:peptide/nickel transport system substrate-binding protein
MRRGAHALGLAAALIATISHSTPVLADKADNSLRIASQDTLPSADPYFNALAIGGVVADAVWDTLIYREPETGILKGDLATAWTWTSERTLELDLRQGVRFHNGAQFDADDVVFTFNFVANPANKAVNQDLARWIDHVEKLGPYKVRIVAKTAFPAAPTYLSSMVIHPHDYYAKVGPAGMSEHPVGTGPYRVVEHARGKYIRFERNGDYFKDSPRPQPKIGKIEMRFIPDPQTRVAEVVSGGVDVIIAVARDQAEQLREVRSLQVISGETRAYSFLTMNTLPNTPAPQLKDIRVRRAIAHAIDRDAMAKFMVGEASRVLHTECHPNQFGCSDEGAPRYSYDPAKARQLLAEAGYPAGFDIDIWAYRDRNQIQAIIGYLGAVGIRARLRFVQASAVTSARRSGRLGLVETSQGRQMPDVSYSVSRYYEFEAADTNRDPEIRDLLRKGDSMLDPEARKAAYANALRLIAERAYALPMYSLSTYYVANRDLVFMPHDDESLRFSEMSWK